MKPPGYHVYLECIGHQQLMQAEYELPFLRYELGKDFSVTLAPNDLSRRLATIYDELVELVPEQEFNTVTISGAARGVSKRSATMSSARGKVIIAPLGMFRGGRQIINGNDIFLEPGSALVFDTMGGTYQPKLGVTRVLAGIRFWLTLQNIGNDSEKNSLLAR